MTKAWARAQDRKRSLIAAGATVALYGLGFLVLLLVGLLVPSSPTTAEGPLVVDLGLPPGSMASIPLGLPNAPLRPAGQAPSPPAPPPSSVSRTAPSAPPVSSGPPPAPSGKAGVSAVAAPSGERGSVLPTPKETGGGGTGSSAAQPPSSRVFSSTPGAPSAGVAAGAPGGSGPGIAGGTGTVTFRGMEEGNEADTTFVAASGTVGRNLYVPIYLYMPLPKQIPGSIYSSIPADSGGYYSAAMRKEAFRHFYTQAGSAWNLKGNVPFDSRAFLWLMLQDAGYDPSHADFKEGKNLQPVKLDFVVAPAAPGVKPKLVYLDLVSSSGSKEIDDAVIYGFRQATFFNNTGTAVSGHFTYDFNAGAGK